MRPARVEKRIKRVDAFLNALRAEVQAAIRSRLPDRTPLRVLEAGCGSTTQLAVEPQWHVTGIDISERQLSRNTLLHEKVLGDIETHRWPPGSFDLIICWDVLEHLPHPDAALTNLLDALAEGGLVVLAFPHILSLKGLVTKFTPFSAAGLFYRHVIGDKRDLSELDQFPTYMRFGILPGRIVALAQRQGLEVCYRKVYEGPVQRYLRALNRLTDTAFLVAGIILKTLTLGKFHPNRTDCILIIQKPAGTR